MNDKINITESQALLINIQLVPKVRKRCIGLAEKGCVLVKRCYGYNQDSTTGFDSTKRRGQEGEWKTGVGSLIKQRSPKSLKKKNRKELSYLVFLILNWTGGAKCRKIRKARVKKPGQKSKPNSLLKD